MGSLRGLAEALLSRAAKHIAQDVTNGSSGYVIRYVRENPRNQEDAPDDFEKTALQHFEDSDDSEYYAMVVYEGALSFRYMARLDINENCLSCHGGPAGTRDPTDHFREGMVVGDLAGANSLVIPLDAYRDQTANRILYTMVFFCIVLIVVIACLRRTLSCWVVNPMRKANQALEKANSAKSEFLTFISHELRTPLASIIAFSSAWEKSADSQSEDDKNNVHEIKENGILLSGMIDNLIDSARVEAGGYRLNFELVDALDVVDVVKSTIEPLAMSKGIQLRSTYDNDIKPVISDWEALRTIIMNLLGNAVKYTDPGGEVVIDCKCNQPGNGLSIQVHDTGCGIANTDLDRIFNRFEQGNNASESGNRARGSGLGLSLSRELATLLGGQLTVESAVGIGSTFTLTLPGKPPVDTAQGE